MVAHTDGIVHLVEHGGFSSIRFWGVREFSFSDILGAPSRRHVAYGVPMTAFPRMNHAI